MPDIESQRHAGHSYAQAITKLRSDRLARAAFQHRVTTLLQPGATIFDFGAGTGIDARFYAERGYRVLAYEPDPQMCAEFTVHCRAGIEAGRVALLDGNYCSFMASNSIGSGVKAELVTANFAPLNLIDEPQKLFARLHALTKPGGRILASVLNPMFIGDMKYPWWWRNRANYWRRGSFSIKGKLWNITRHSPARFDALAQPYFRLAWARGRMNRYLLLLFERR